MAESVRVICRCRPLNRREIDLNSKICVDMDPLVGQVVLHGDGPEKLFSFDGVYYLDATAEAIYNDIIYPLVENVIEGYNGTVFAYGQTGSGKTYSMQGDEKVPAQKGVIPRTFEHIFEAIATTEHTKFLVHASYLEIYNEEVRDLLGKNRDQKLEVKEHSDRGIYVAGLSMHVCHSYHDCERLMQMGFNNRHVGATLMNKDSSRSHSIFTIYVEALSETGSIRMGKLNLVDLAGSERQAKTGAVGDRFKEATKINLSLSALGNVISALVDGKSKHIPYRDSKLTRLLQDSLGGNTKTVMIACISPSDNNYDESLSTLRYANRAKNIKNKPRINEDPKDALLREYQQEIERLKGLVKNPEKVVGPSQEEIENEKAKLRAEFEQAMKELRSEYENEQKGKAKLEQDLSLLKQQYENANKDLETIQKSSQPIDEKEAKKRLEILEQQLVGGEKANDEALKQKRVKKMKEAEKKMQRLAQAIQNADHDDPLLQAYSSTQEKLDALSKKFNYEVQKVRSLESEIQDITAEFELDRLDYLETIRRQDQQLKLFQQLMEKVQPAIKKDSNYYDIEKIKKTAVWNEDQSRWFIPDLQMNRHTLPNANTIMPAASADLNHFSDTDGYDLDDSRLKKRLERSMEEDFVKNYFKQINKNDLINKYKADRHNSMSQDKISNFMKRNQRVNGLMTGVLYTDDIYANGQANEIPNGVRRVPSSVKKPQRLESLNVSRSRF